MPTDFDDLQEITIPVRLNTDAMQRDMQRLQQLSQRFSSRIASTFADAIVSGRKFSDVLRSLAQQLLRMSLTAALRPALGGLTSAIGSAFGALTTTPFARGGVVGSPTLFASPSGLGLMGEAGPEAILPLKRGPDGRLGVATSGGQPVQITMNITTPDAEGFRRNRGRITAELARTLAEGQRNL